jgi:hypothetical protein
MGCDSPFRMNERNEVTLVGNCRSKNGGIRLEDG